MKLDNSIYGMKYEVLLHNMYSSFIREFGQRKFDKIYDKIHSSNKVREFIIKSKRLGLAPYLTHNIELLNEIPYFIFSRGQTMAIGALILLEKWDQEVNQQSLISNSEELRSRAVFILTENKSQFF